MSTMPACARGPQRQNPRNRLWSGQCHDPEYFDFHQVDFSDFAAEAPFATTHWHQRPLFLVPRSLLLSSLESKISLVKVDLWVSYFIHRFASIIFDRICLLNNVHQIARLGGQPVFDLHTYFCPHQTVSTDAAKLCMGNIQKGPFSQNFQLSSCPEHLSQFK